eukprot:3975983-Pyramimonas_sp.AAC.1
MKARTSCSLHGISARWHSTTTSRRAGPTEITAPGPAEPDGRALSARGPADHHLVANVETALPRLGGAGLEGAANARDRRGLEHALQSDLWDAPLQPAGAAFLHHRIPRPLRLPRAAAAWRARAST